MIKNEIYHEDGTFHAYVTREAFRNDVTERIALSWVRDSKLTAIVVEVPEESVRPILPGLVANLPRVQSLLVRCLEGQEATVRAFVPFHVGGKVKFLRHGEFAQIAVVESIDREGKPVLRLENIY